MTLHAAQNYQQESLWSYHSISRNGQVSDCAVCCTLHNMCNSFLQNPESISPRKLYSIYSILYWLWNYCIPAYNIPGALLLDIFRKLAYFTKGYSVPRFSSYCLFPQTVSSGFLARIFQMFAISQNDTHDFGWLALWSALLVHSVCHLGMKHTSHQL